MRQIDKIIIHCSASDFGDVDVIDRWHRERGFNDIGYHYVILNNHPKNTRVSAPTDGMLQFGRSVRDVGAHCHGQNSNSIGICLIGEETFSEAQMRTLGHLVESLMVQYGISPDMVFGHYEYSDKSCPNFDVDQWMEKLLEGESAPEVTGEMRNRFDIGTLQVEMMDLKRRVNILEMEET